MNLAIYLDRAHFTLIIEDQDTADAGILRTAVDFWR